MQPDQKGIEEKASEGFLRLYIQNEFHCNKFPLSYLASLFPFIRTFGQEFFLARFSITFSVFRFFFCFAASRFLVEQGKRRHAERPNSLISHPPSLGEKQRREKISSKAENARNAVHARKAGRIERSIRSVWIVSFPLSTIYILCTLFRK